MPSRRSFLAGTAAGLTAASAAQVSGANDRIRVGAIGCGTRGGTHLVPAFQAQPDCDVVAVCDVFQPNLDRAKGHAAPGAEAYRDYRQVLVRDDLDAIIVGTPDHWHAPLLIAACEAGKDVYCEKPISNAIEPAVAMVEAAHKHDRVVQIGLQQRHWKHFMEAYELFRKGQLDKVNHVGLIRRGSTARPDQPTTQPPANLDWEMFQGAAEHGGYSQLKQRDWRRFPQFGGGIITDWGIHLLDVAMWSLHADTQKPLKVSAVAKTLWRSSDERLPDTISVQWEYDDFGMTFANWGQPYGTYLYGQNGLLHVDREGFTMESWTSRFRPEPKFESIHTEGVNDYPSIDTSLGDHVRDFLDCMKSREQPVTNIDVGFNSTLPTLLALLAIKTGKSYTWDGKAAQEV